MARFVVNQPITTAEPAIPVDAGLPVGRHRFRLQVIDSTGRTSPPDEATVEVQRLVTPPIVPISPTRPTVIDPTPTPTPIDPLRLDPRRLRPEEL